MHTTRKTLLALALATAGIALPMASVAALPPPGDDGGGDRNPIERPTSTTSAEPVTTTTGTARRLQRFDVTTNSVVATAVIHFSGIREIATVDWGDGTSTTRCPPGDPSGGIHGCFVPPFSPPDPAGTIVFTHTYAAPANGGAFTPAITARFAGESVTVGVGITPRYLVTQSDLQFSPLNHCDTFLEEYTEWRIDREGFGLLPAATWEFDRLSNPAVNVGGWLPQFAAIPGSGFSVELTAASAGRIGYDADEKDLIEDSSLFRVFLDLHPARGTRTVSLPTQAAAANPHEEQCRAEFRADVTVELLKPGLTGGGGPGGGGGGGGGGPVAHQ